MNNEKMIRDSKTIDKILNVIEKCLFAGGIVMIVMMILIAIFGEKMIADPNSLSLGNISVNFKNIDETQLSSLTGYIEMLMVPAFIIIAVSWYGIKMFRKVLKPMKEGHPFEKSSAGNVRKLGVFVLIGGILTNICGFAASTLEYKLCSINGIFNMDVISEVSLDYTFEFGFIFVALVIFLLAHVFSYGEALQIEADETL